MIKTIGKLAQNIFHTTLSLFKGTCNKRKPKGRPKII